MLIVALLLGLVAITVLGGVAFGAIVGSPYEAEDMSDSSSSISVQSDPDGSGPAGDHLRWESGAGVSARASESVTVPAGSAVNQIQLFTRQASGGRAVFAIYVDGTSTANKVGTFSPPAESWGIRTVNLSTAIQPRPQQHTHTIYIGPNATFGNRASIDWFELHNTAAPTGGDTTPPLAPNITTGPAAGSTDTDGNVSFTWTGETGGTFECSNVISGQVDNFSACTSPTSIEYDGLSNGSYIFKVRQIDAAGNVGAAASRNYSVSTPTGGDTTAPETAITSGSVTGTAATFEFTSDEPGSTFGCQLLPLESAPTSCTSPKPYGDLTAGTEYTFSVRATDASDNTDATPATRSFTPSGDPPPPTTSARLVGAGDIATSGSMDTATANLILERPDARVFTAGDNAYPDGAASDFTNKYHPAWGPFKNRTSPSPGNHEYRTSGASAYKTYFGSVAGLRSVNPTYYAYTLGAWRVYALDSNISMAIGSPQYNFVQNDLASNGALCELAYWHHPIASSGQHGNIAVARPIFALFDAQGGDLVLNGHDHNYERFNKINSLGQISDSGVSQIIVGTGGTSLRGEGFVQPGSEVRNSADDFNTHGIVDINLSSTGYSGTFVPVPGKTFTDSFSGTCGTT